MGRSLFKGFRIHPEKVASRRAEPFTDSMEMEEQKSLSALYEQLAKRRQEARKIEKDILSMESRVRANCEHKWDRQLPCGMRDNNEFIYVCSHCRATS